MSQVVQDTTVRWVSERWASEPVGEPDLPAFGFLEVPFDYAVSHRPGTRFGPASILAALNTFTLYCTDKRVSLAHSHFHHFGTVDVVNDFKESYRRIREAVARLPAGYTLVALGGDHSISDPLVRGVQDRLGEKKLGLIVFDAHFDSRDPVPGKEHSGHWMKTLEDTLDYTSAVQLGINAPIYGERYMAEAEEKGILVKTLYEIRKAGWDAVLAEAVEHATSSTDGLYLSVDIDSLDQAFAPGTSVPNPAGFFPHEVLDAVYEIGCRADVVGFDLTEVSPPLDRDGFTSQLAAHLVLSFLSGSVVRHQNGQDQR